VTTMYGVPDYVVEDPGEWDRLLRAQQARVREARARIGWPAQDLDQDFDRPISWFVEPHGGSFRCVVKKDSP
jgi:hypothetical protein